MTTEQMIEEALMRLRAKVKKLVKDNVRYLVSDPDDDRVGILAQEQMENWVVSLCKKEFHLIATKSAEEEQEKARRIIVMATGEPESVHFYDENLKILSNPKDTND